MKLARWIPILLLSSACVSIRVPPHAAASRWGIVHADDPATADAYARVLDDVAPLVARSLPGLVIEPVDLRVVGHVSRIFDPKPPVEPVGAFIEGEGVKWVEIRADAEPIALRHTIAHELVHRWLGPHWKPLPPALEDGLCNAVAKAVAGQNSPCDRMAGFVSAWITLNGELRVDCEGRVVEPGTEVSSLTIRSKVDRMAPADLLDAMERDHDRYFSIELPYQFRSVILLSELLISRLSLDRLFELCVTAEQRSLELVPADWICEAAGFDPIDRSDWNELLLGIYGEPERSALRAAVPIGWALLKPQHGELRMTVSLNATASF